MCSFPSLEPVCYSTSGSNCCFLTCIQISQEVGEVVWYSHLFKNFPQFFVTHTVKNFWLSSIKFFPNESASHQVAKYWSFSFSISPANEYSGLISFAIDWFDLLAVQGTLKSLLQHCSSKASILWCSAFFMMHFSHLYMTTGKTIALTRWTLSAK